jgi:hypothetical protein
MAGLDESPAGVARAELRTQLRRSMAAIVAARQHAVDDQARADALREQALEAKAAAEARRAAVLSFTPAATYDPQDLVSVRGAIADVLARQALVLQALADSYTYRGAVDANAVVTDDAIISLARLMSRSA